MQTCSLVLANAGINLHSLMSVGLILRMETPFSLLMCFGFQANPAEG